MHIADLIRDRLEQHPGLRSIVEIGIGPTEVAELREWACTATLLHLEKAPRDFALAFLSCATVAAREKASEHELWPHVRAWFLAPGGARLFVGDRPCPLLLAAIERTCGFFNLRHVFNRGEGEHRWYITVLLQCGFTRPAMKRLPEWLAGHSHWRSIELLLQDPALASPTFVAAFERLRAVRLGWFDDVPVNPWLEGDLNQLACEAAGKRLSLGTSAAGPSAASGVRLLDLPGAGLAFGVPLAVPDGLIGRGPPHIDFDLGGRRGPRAHRQHDGSYSDLFDEQVRLAAVPETGSLKIRLLGPEELLLHEEDLALFAGEEDLDFYVAAGSNQYRRVTDPWVELAPECAVILRVADDLPLQGTFAMPEIKGCRSRWQRVEPDEMQHVQVPFGDDLTWTFLLDQSKRWPGSVEVHGDGQPWSTGAAMEWTLSLTPRSARIRSARLGRQRLVVKNTSNGACRLMLPAQQFMPLSFGLRLCIEDSGQRFNVSCDAPPPASQHLLTRANDGWHVLEVADLTSLARPVRWFAGDDKSDDTPWLFEGGRPVLPLVEREVILAPRLSGFGGTLSIESRRFNCKDRLATVCSSLGLPRQLHLKSWFGGQSSIVLAPSFAWRDDFVLYVLGEDGAPRSLSTHQYAVTSGNIIVRTEVPIVAAAVSCRGEFISTTVSNQVVRAIDATSDVDACIRWLFVVRAPVATPYVRAALIRAAMRQPLAAIALGAGDVRPIDEAEVPLHWDEFLKGFWRECVEEILLTIDDALDGAESVAQVLLDPKMNPFASSKVDVPGNAVACAITHLAESDPVLAVRVLQAACRSRDRALSRVLRGARDELRAAAVPPSLEDIAHLLAVDSGFVSQHQRTAVQWALGLALPGQRLKNIRRLLYLSEFRRAVACDAIRQLTTEEPDAGRRPGHR